MFCADGDKAKQSTCFIEVEIVNRVSLLVVRQGNIVKHVRLEVAEGNPWQGNTHNRCLTFGSKATCQGNSQACWTDGGSR